MQASGAKFEIRPSLADCWTVIAPDGQTEEMENFAAAIAMLDIWIGEYRCKLMGQAKMSGTVARA